MEDPVSRLPDVSPPTSSSLLPGSSPSSIPKLRKAKPRGRNRESLDLDEIMDGDDDADLDLEDASVSGGNDQSVKPSSLFSPPQKGLLQLKSATTNGPSTTREILQFLDQGPPDEEYASSVVSAAVSSVSTTKSKTGRLMNMMSKLRRGTSNDKVGRSAAMDSSMSVPSILQTSNKGPFASSPTLTVPPPLRRPKSVHSLAGSNRYAPSSWIPPIPPPPPQPPRPEPLRADLPPSKPADLPTPTVSPPPSQDSFSAQVDPVSLPSPVSMQFKALGPPSRKGSLNRKRVPTLILTSGQSDTVVHPPADPVPQPLSPQRPIHPEMNGSPEPTHAPNSGIDQQTIAHFKQPRTPTSPNTPNKCSTGPTLSPVDETSSPTSSSATIDKNERAIPSLPRDDPPASHAHSVDPDSTDWISRAAELRKALVAARHVDEARLLVDMFFARWGIPVNDSNPVPLPQETLTNPSPSLSFISEEHSVIEALLGDGDLSP
ncbi:hypothetical protein BS47DRAFT_399466 [Hydnum rufescens UP504]|uniref:Uncharacterized protein n=1 Tax=Hydnum rufescens UP504 TaxID=1448309 RepID=A0A9P6BAG5_9AGAM|nr:hypothetical protein BS47DRAFT_399466 [Hydnum rufescens UP504]